MKNLPCARTRRIVHDMHHLMRVALAWCALVSVSLAMTGCTSLPASSASDHLARVELLAMLQTLNADLLSHDSATLTLERWCADHRLAEPARIVARRLHDAARPLPSDLRALLQVEAGEPIGYLQLMCGNRVLSEADNWYVPGRLTAEMNQSLDSTDEPFGKVVRPLDFRRRTLSADLLWSPLPAGWEMSATPSPTVAGRTALRIPDAVLRHRAILFSAAQVPFSAVVETYTNELFYFGRWGPHAAAPH
jgi:hypothetical protein